VQQVHVFLLPLAAGTALLLHHRVRQARELQPAREPEPAGLLRPRHVDDRLQVAVAAMPVPVPVVVAVMRHAVHARTVPV
jgi:hypothetical protein